MTEIKKSAFLRRNEGSDALSGTEDAEKDGKREMGSLRLMTRKRRMQHLQEGKREVGGRCCGERSLLPRSATYAGQRFRTQATDFVEGKESPAKPGF